MNNVWVIEWVCYPYTDGSEERHIEKVCKSKMSAIEWCNNDEEFYDNFLIVGDDQEKFFERHRCNCVSHYEISCWDVD